MTHQIIADETRLTSPILQVTQIEILLHVRAIHLGETTRNQRKLLQCLLFGNLLLLLFWNLTSIHIHIFCNQVADLERVLELGTINPCFQSLLLIYLEIINPYIQKIDQFLKIHLLIVEKWNFVLQNDVV